MKNLKRFHFVGIGGIGMSAIAQMLARNGCAVSGSDIRKSAITDELGRIGVRVFLGHSAAHLDGAECVVYSSSIDPENPELAEARRRGISVKHRSQALASLSAGKWTAAVSGTHGKSTTASLLGWIWRSCGLDPTVVVGAKVDQFGGNLLVGTGNAMIIEADESDASFLEYEPDAAIVTNIDTDHLDHFESMERVERTFADFLARLKTGGRWYGCRECPRTARLLDARGSRGTGYGFSASSDWRAADARTGADGGSFVLYRGAPLGEVRIRLHGVHNILNTTAAMALAIDAGIPFEKARDAAALYRGAARRFDFKINAEDITLIDDYAHHPTEVRATLAAARGFSPRRILAVFQPHRFTRTRILESEFAGCFSGADELIVTDIYAAGERPAEGVTAAHLAQAIAARHAAVRYVPRPELVSRVTDSTRKGDIVITLGAGDIAETAEELKAVYERKFAVRR